MCDFNELGAVQLHRQKDERRSGLVGRICAFLAVLSALLPAGLSLAQERTAGRQPTAPAAALPDNLNLPDDMSAVPVDEEENVVETVKLGGEDRVPAQQEGVQQDDTTPGWTDDRTPIKVTPAAGEQPDITAPSGVTNQAPAAIPDDGEASHAENERDPSRVAYAVTRKNARTMSLTIPAPRGMITDRNGNIYASSEVAWQPAIDYRLLVSKDPGEIVRVGRVVMEKFKAAGFKVNEKTDEQLLSHYKDRRWLALPIGAPVREKELTDAMRKKVEAIEYGRLMSLYLRVYPAKESACHILGYTGSPAKLPTGPINHNDPIFERREGRFGLEKIFNQQLSGRPGLWRLMFDEHGNKLLDELQVHPSPGHTLVTTLNMKWQSAAEKTLRENTLGRGAFVMVDVQTGEVLVLASVPNYDPNAFIPSISQKDYDALRADKNTPLVSRAFAGVYPPASTFKTITVAAALRYRVINEHTIVNCPQSIMIGNHRFRNHSSFSGNINCVTAIVLSNNPFMYQVAATRDPRIGAARLCETARRFGYGSVTGLPLADKAGNVPDDAWMYRNYGRGFMAGDAANMSIGQGALLATPLQVAHAISGIANGSYLPKLQLIRQVLDPEGNVVYQFTPAVQNNLSDMSAALAVVRKGMRAVVDGGTGRRAALGWVSSAGKTGTAQWGRPADDCRLAWFAGFLPADKPRYAYAALYEGRPHQKISGGHMAAAIVRNFFNEIRPSLEEELKKETKKVGLPEGQGLPRDEEEAELEAEREEAARREAEEREEGVRRRHSQSGWDDGRDRH